MWRSLGAGVVIIAAVAAFAWFTRSSDAVNATIDQRVSSIVVDVTTGTVEIVRGDDPSVHLAARADDGWMRSAQVSHDVDGDTLHVRGECGGTGLLPAFGCRTDVTLTVPAGVDVVAETKAGSVHATGLSGTTELRSAAGDITVTGQAAPLKARTSTGDITVTDLRVDEAHVSSTAGAVFVQTTQPPRSLDAESSAGAVTVRLPAGERYDVEARSRTGGVDVGVDVTYTSPYKVRAMSTTGAVSVGED